MDMNDIFTREELHLIMNTFGPGNRNMVFGLAFRLDFMDKSGFLEDVRAHFASQCRSDFPERQLAKKYLKQEFAGKKILELGPGFVGDKLNNAHFFADLGASEYVGVEPTIKEEESMIPPITFIPTYARDQERVTLDIPYALIRQDGLSYLLTQPDDSAAVFSSCVFRSDTLTDIGLPPELGKRYVNELIKQMYRVTQKGAINIHADNAFDCRRFEEAGFRVELHGEGKTPESRQVKNTEQAELQYLIGSGGVILRK